MNKSLTLRVVSFVLSIFMHYLLLGPKTTPIVQKTNYSTQVGAQSYMVQVSLKKEEHLQNSKQIGKREKKKSHSSTKKSFASSTSKSKVNSGQSTLIAKYLTKLRSFIVKNQKSSPIIKKLKLTGSVTVEFLVSRPNTVSKIKVVKSSKVSFIDKSALKTIQSLADLPAIPTAIKENSFLVESTITYDN